MKKIKKLSLYSLKLTNTYFSGIYKIMANYVERLKAKLKIKKLDSDQPLNAWLFVLILNLIGLAGYAYLKMNNIHLGD